AVRGTAPFAIGQGGAADPARAGDAGRATAVEAARARNARGAGVQARRPPAPAVVAIAADPPDPGGQRRRPHHPGHRAALSRQLPAEPDPVGTGTAEDRSQAVLRRACFQRGSDRAAGRGTIAARDDAPDGTPAGGRVADAGAAVLAGW